MKHILVFILFVLSFCNRHYGQEYSIVLEAKMEENRKDSIEINFWSVYDVDVTQNPFKLSFKKNNNLLKTSIVSTSAIWASNIPFLGKVYYLFEPGDSIRIQNSENTLSFSGKGADRVEMMYRINQALARIKTKENMGRFAINSSDDFFTYRRSVEMVYNEQMKIFEQYSTKISSFAYTYLKSYYLNELRLLLCEKFKELKFNSYKHGISSSVLTSIYDSVLIHYKPGEEHDIDVASLPGNVVWALRDYSSLELSRNENFKESEEDSDLKRHIRQYYYSKNRYKGLAREKVLTNILTFSMLRKSTAREYLACVEDYLSTFGYPKYKKYVKAYMDRKMLLKRGMEAPDFELEDTAGRKIFLRDFKGKLVVLDFWFTGCKGCVDMASSLTRVEEYFRGNREVVFLSISIDSSKSHWLKSIVKRKYTTGKGTNLYTSGRGLNHSIIERYRVDAYPALFMIDPNGKFYNPVPDPRNDLGKALIKLINETIAAQFDGPYIFYKNGFIISKKINYEKDKKTLKNDSVILSKRMDIPISAITDNPASTFSVKLKPNIKTELCEYKMAEKVLALSDIEGNFTAFSQLLQANGVIDDNYNWSFGKGHLVLIGDFFDRGNQVTECLWLIYSLEDKAKANGGYVHFIIGNHEIMNLSGDLRYVQPKYKENAKLIGEDYLTLYGKDSELGCWLRSKNIIEKIGNVLFVHAGISDEINQLPISITEINNLARKYYDKQELAKRSDDPKLRMLYNDSSPFWYRFYYKKTKKILWPNGDIDTIFQANQSQIERTLLKFDVKMIVTGHTIVEPGDHITTHFDGKVINTDTEHAQGKSEALLIENDIFYAISLNSSKRMLYSFRSDEEIQTASFQRTTK